MNHVGATDSNKTTKYNVLTENLFPTLSEKHFVQQLNKEQISISYNN